MKIGALIRKYRKQAKMTQAELAAAINKTQPAIVKYENDEREPSFDVLNDITRALGISMSDLLSDLSEDNARLSAKSAMHERTEEYFLKFTNAFWRMCIEEAECKPIDWVVMNDNSARWIIEDNDSGVSYLVDEDDLLRFFDRFVDHLKIEFIPFLKEKGISDYKQLLIDNGIDVDRISNGNQD